MSRNRILFSVLTVALMSFNAGCGSGDAAPAGPAPASDAGTGGGGAGSGGGTGGGSGGAGSGGSGSGATTVGAAEGEWSAMVPVLGGLDGVWIRGIVTADGAAYFEVNTSLLFGSMLANPQGTVEAHLVRYDMPGESIAVAANGPLSESKDPSFDHAVARTSLSGRLRDVIGFDSFALHYLPEYERPAALSTLASVYTTAEYTSYLLTLSVNADGQISGSDTHGCALVGSAAVPDPTRNVYTAELDVSSCGGFDGHYSGILSLSDETTPNDNRLVLLAAQSVSPVAGRNVIYQWLFR
jgi:hypothetical protein